MTRHTRRLSLPAPAKLNLFLHITGRRADGYHTLQTIFQFIELCDSLTLETREDGELVLEHGAPGVPPEQDLVLRAARALQQASGTRLGANLRLEKRIPLGGGLGGGSSDAASTLLGLNRLWELNWPREKLAGIGIKLGADVPVFVHGQAAWAEGIGEILTPLPDLPRPWYLLIHPGCHVATAEIFRAKELTRDTKSMKIADFLSGGEVGNDCCPVVRGRYPAVARALDWLAAYAPSRLTGTGACVFAAFSQEHAARALLRQVPGGWQAWVARALNRSPA
jgi:4-diphosphocytidyl-2-C-methyl-D-erythritol kinase